MQCSYFFVEPSGVYDIPGYGRLAYCGLAGFYPLINMVLQDNLMNHPLCKNIREGTWMFDYITNRLEPYKSLFPIHKCLNELFDMVKGLPAYLYPKYFCAIVKIAYEEAVEICSKRLGVADKSWFIKSLSLGSVQMIGRVQSTGLTPKQEHACIAAGLPYFSTHHMRVWGRDVFLSFKGLFLHLGRYEEARDHLISFAGCLYKGLIPNLLDSGRRPRYNSRDATWFFLQAVQEYYKYAPDGHASLHFAL